MRKLGVVILTVFSLTGCSFDVNININHIPPVEVKPYTEDKPEKENKPMAENTQNTSLITEILRKGNKPSNRVPDKKEVAKYYEIYSKELAKLINESKTPKEEEFWNGVWDRVSGWVSQEDAPKAPREFDRIDYDDLLGLVDIPGVMDLLNAFDEAGEAGKPMRKKPGIMAEIPKEFIPLLDGLDKYKVPDENGERKLSQDGFNRFTALRQIATEYLASQGYDIDALRELAIAYYDPNFDEDNLTQVTSEYLQGVKDLYTPENLKGYEGVPDYAKPRPSGTISVEEVFGYPETTESPQEPVKAPEIPQEVSEVTTPVPVAPFTSTDYSSLRAYPPIRYSLTPEERGVIASSLANALRSADEAYKTENPRKFGDLGLYKYI